MFASRQLIFHSRNCRFNCLKGKTIEIKVNFNRESLIPTCCIENLDNKSRVDAVSNQPMHEVNTRNKEVDIPETVPHLGGLMMKLTSCSIVESRTREYDRDKKGKGKRGRGMVRETEELFPSSDRLFLRLI